MNNYDNYFYKYNKYRIKNKLIGSGWATAISQGAKAAKQAASIAKGSIDQARKAALEVATQIRKEMNDNEIKELLETTLSKENYKELYGTLDRLVTVLKITNINKLIEKQNEIMELVSTIYKIINTVEKLGGSLKEQFNKLEKYINMILPAKKEEKKEKKEEKKEEKNIRSNVKSIEYQELTDLKQKFIDRCSERYAREVKCRKLEEMKKKYGCN
jgi:hypothetical protein